MRTTGWRGATTGWGEKADDLVNEPHQAVCCDRTGIVLNLVARESEPSRQGVTMVARSRPELTLNLVKKIRDREAYLGKRTPGGASQGQLSLGSLFGKEWNTGTDSEPGPAAFNSGLPEENYVFPRFHAVPAADRINKVLLEVYEQQPEDFATLLSLPGVGAGTIRALALVAEVVFGARPSFRDPVRYAFAHGGKDGHPYPVNREDFDHSIHVLDSAIKQAAMGRNEKLEALRRLARFSEAEAGKPLF